MKTSPRLLYADTSNRDAFYFGRVAMGDPFLAFEAGGRKIAVINALDFSRVKRTSEFDRVLRWEEIDRKVRGRLPRQRAGLAEVIAQAVKSCGGRRFRVAGDFPAQLYVQLRKQGLKLEFADGPLFPEREIKSPAEADAIREANGCAVLGFAAVEKILRESRIRGRNLWWQGAIVTSERLQRAVEIALLDAGAIPGNPIVAGGNQACDPHERGSGPIRPHELIVLDLCPRIKKTGYCGDMSRTFLKGHASEAQHALVTAVRGAQERAIATIRTAVTGKEVHQVVVDHFTVRGYQTKKTKQGSVGFFHSTGHGLGLAVHDGPPTLSDRGTVLLKAGAVVTVEPGLYYPGLGGCRIEDVVQVQKGGAKPLSKFHYRWELP